MSEVKYGVVIEEIIETLVEESDSDVILTRHLHVIIANALDLSLNEVKKYLKEANSKYLYDVIGFIDKKPIIRTNLIYHFQKTMKKLAELSKRFADDTEMGCVFEEIENQYSSEGLLI